MTKGFSPNRLNLQSKGVAKILGDAEAKIVTILWERGPLTVRDVLTELKEQNHPLSFNATMTILNRLVEKDVLSKQHSGRGRGVFRYAPVADRATFLERMTKEMFRRVFRDDELFSVAGFADAIDELPDEERKKLTQLLRKKQR